MRTTPLGPLPCVKFVEFDRIFSGTAVFIAPKNGLGSRQIRRGNAAEHVALPKNDQGITFAQSVMMHLGRDR